MPRVKLIDKRSSPSQPFLRDSPPSSVPGHGWKGMINLSAAPLLFSVSHTGLPLSSLSFLLSLSLCPCSFSCSISSHPLPDSLRLFFYLSHLHFVHFQSLVGWHACFFLHMYRTCTWQTADIWGSVFCSFLRARPLFLHWASLTPSLSKNQNTSAATQSWGALSPTITGCFSRLPGRGCRITPRSVKRPLKSAQLHVSRRVPSGVILSQE